MRWTKQNLMAAEIEPGKTKRTIADPELAGLYFEVRKHVRTFVVRWRQMGKMNSRTIGYFPDLSIQEARLTASEIKAAARRADAAQKGAISPNITVTQFVREHFEPLVLTKLRESVSQLRLYENHIMPYFGGMRFSQINKASVYHWAGYLTDKGLKNTSQNRIRILFGQILSFAVDMEVPGAPDRRSVGLKQLPVFPSHTVFLKPEEVDRLKAALRQSSNGNLLDIVSFLLLTGARKREALDAEWQHIDLKNRQWLVPRSKNGRPRYIQLSEAAIGLLMKRRIEGPHATYVFTNPATGLPYRCIHNGWKAARELAGLPHLRVHDLRHSYASALVNRGATLYDVQHLLGHSSIRTTQRYAHLASDRLKSAAALIDDTYG